MYNNVSWGDILQGHFGTEPISEVEMFDRK
jgi:hypothetical protein